MAILSVNNKQGTIMAQYSIEVNSVKKTVDVDFVPIVRYHHASTVPASDKSPMARGMRD